ncbi:formate dehydrogenase subunit gamma [Undibacterium sp. Jales W-56]|uniref:formate dehydrogenase subunit gamma n=1 Tax=Undibacterium sp. Jales W-56 TaxID=2897325 RepID=UPI0021CFD51D|nr:formate dehydrogenase subunit gamma [Undibacterium sp. Jales W-56]MCU6432905.1 formate dehydrogenase subunit gamma [Undibacterium sp. Jales W-56]
MKQVFASLAIVAGSLFLAPASDAVAQNQAVPDPAPAAASAAIAPLPDKLGGIESIDILKQNQAERTKDQPGNLAPTFRIVNDGQKNYSSLPALEAGVLIQGKTQFPGQTKAVTAGEAWRQYRNGPLTLYGGWLILLALAAVIGVYSIRGQVKLSEPRTGRLIERFTPGERTLHWTMALSFVSLAISGMIMLFGKHVLMPVFGLTLFGWLAFLCKNIHNFIGPVFSVSIILFFVKFVKDNLPTVTDIKWFAKFGGLLSGEHVSSHRFNAGEKVVFWGVVVFFGLIVTGSGFVLDMLVPNFEYTRAVMQLASVIHIVAALLAAAMVIGHIYLGTLGMEGAYEAMRTGYVDDSWAKEHHDLWYADIENGKIPRLRTSEPAATAAPGNAATSTLNA